MMINCRRKNKQLTSFMQRHRFLLVQLMSNGDCLYATTVAHQIKVDYPNCHLTWAVSSMCRPILYLNPYIDEVWEVPLLDKTEILKQWCTFEKEIYKRKENGDFDEIFVTQFVPNHLENYDGLNRSSIFRGYRRPVEVPIIPILYLSQKEVDNVANFVNEHNLKDKKYVILFECSPQSEQSFIDLNFALDVSKKIINELSNICVILTSNVSIPYIDKNIIDGSILSIRENAELIKYCSLLIGCSSGITWISTSNWSHKIPMIQLLKARPFWFASVIHDHNYWGLSTDHIIEMTECSTEVVSNCVKTVIQSSFQIAKLKYSQELIPNLDYYGYMLRNFLIRFQIKKALKFINIHVSKHGKYKLIKWHLLRLIIFLPLLPWRIWKKLFQYIGNSKLRSK